MTSVSRNLDARRENRCPPPHSNSRLRYGGQVEIRDNLRIQRLLDEIGARRSLASEARANNLQPASARPGGQPCVSYDEAAGEWDRTR